MRVAQAEPNVRLSVCEGLSVCVRVCVAKYLRA